MREPSAGMKANRRRREPVQSRPYRLLVFDWDGTLMDSIASIVACTEATLSELGWPASPPAAIRAAVGLSIRDTVAQLHPDADEAAAQRLMETYRRLWFGGFRNRALAFPGTGSALAALAADGYLLAVATGKSRRGLDHDLAATGLGHHFHASRTADETQPKPHPQMLLELLDELGAGPSEALMIGDSRWDLEMAAEAGVGAVALASGSHQREELVELAELRPLAILDGVSDLPEWLRRRYPST